MAPNKTLVFKKIPTGFPVPGEHLAVEDRPLDLEAAPPKGGLIVEILYASFDPYLRGKMRDASVKSYTPAFEMNGPFTNSTISRVLKSGTSDFNQGDIISAYTPIAEYAIIPDPSAAQARKINNPYNLDLGMFLGPLGMPGLTAYSSLHKIGKPKKGETIFISSAAGAVGQVVAQIAKNAGLKTIGSVGSDEKLSYIMNELDFDGGFNYKKESPFDALKRLAPNGIDIYYENVGGEHLDAALENMNTHGRIPVCGMISGYNSPPDQRYGVKNLMQLVVERITMQGFLVFDPEFGPAYFEEHQKQVQKWIAEGSFKAKLHVTEGIDNAAEGFVGMLKGDNFGKAVLKIRD
ncbi:NAD(P)-binding protein [Daldinia caldariorum]|uniref:NAD(P)-binding protein n=1 Tax=Daldinia caldariorum TaxID=326644 RepID=UPI002007D6E6|nr:NAD(P)-binding protein [Daldinia caldariorum]KAI1471839.1 NAD(P)-binding protein [Daldinia caldariorum]